MEDSTDVLLAGGKLAEAGRIANEYAAQALFAEFNLRKAMRTRMAYLGDLACFADYLREVAGADVDAAQLQTAPDAWAGVSWGLVQGFVRWMLNNGLAVATVNRRLTAVKVYAGVAAQAGAIDGGELALIRTVRGYGGKEARRVDEQRTEADVATRKGKKKARHVAITHEAAEAMRQQPDTPQGRRDALLMCLLLDHGLRAGELAGLQVENFDVRAGTFHFLREKVSRWQTHRMTMGTLRAAAVWLVADAFASGPLLRGSRKGGELTKAGITPQSISDRVRVLGERVGVKNLSAHDCRHYWATYWATKTDILRLQDAGGWSSVTMVQRYVEFAKIANEGMA